MNGRNSKTNIELKTKNKPRTKLKIKNLQYKTLKNILNYKIPNTSKNSNIKSNINIKSKKEISIPNNSEKITKRKDYNKIIINNTTTNEDKDLESLLSELKITFNPKKIHYNKNENYLNINKYKNKFSLLTNEDLTIDKKEDNNNIDYIDFQFDLEEEGNEISQRVHKKNPKIHFTLENKEKEITVMTKLTSLGYSIGS